jgi:hypothetical protein
MKKLTSKEFANSTDEPTKKHFVKRRYFHHEGNSQQQQKHNGILLNVCFYIVMVTDSCSVDNYLQLSVSFNKGIFITPFFLPLHS